MVLEPIPRQLDAVKPATEFPVERHRWNTNEVPYGESRDIMTLNVSLSDYTRRALSVRCASSM